MPKKPTLNSSRRARIDYLRSLPDGTRRNALRAMKAQAKKPAKRRAKKPAAPAAE